MRKFFLSCIFFLSLHSCAFAFASSDTQLIISKLEGINQRIDDLNKRIDDFQASTEKEFAKVYKHIDDKIADVKQYVDVKINGVNAQFIGVNQRIDSTNDRIDDLKFFLTIGLTFLALFLGSPIYAPALKKFYAQFEQPRIPFDEIKSFVQNEIQSSLKNSNNQPG